MGFIIWTQYSEYQNVIKSEKTKERFQSISTACHFQKDAWENVKEDQRL